MVDLSTGVILGAPSLTTVTILANDRRVFFPTPASLIVAEGVGIVSVEVLIYPAHDADLIIPITVDSGGTLLDADFSYDETVIFLANETSATFDVTIVDDDLVEGDESVTFTFGDEDGNLPENVEAGGQTTHTLTVEDNDNYEVSFVVNDYSLPEGNSGTVFSIDLRLSPAVLPVDSPIEIPIIVDNSSTAALSDYILPNPSIVTFDVDKSVGSYRFVIVGDIDDEDDEQLVFALGKLPEGVVPGTMNQLTYTIRNDDPPPVSVVSRTVEFFSPSSMLSENGGTMQVLVTIDPPPGDLNLIVEIMVDNSSTAEPDDYILLPFSIVTFIPSKGTAVYAVEIVNDSMLEGPEQLVLTFGNLPGGVSVGANEKHTLTVVDDDGYMVSFDIASQTVVEGVGTVQVAVSIFPTPAAAAAPITIPIVVDASSTATMADCTLPDSSVVTFTAGETSKNYVVTIVDDVEVEESEFVAFAFGTLPDDVVSVNRWLFRAPLGNNGQRYADPSSSPRLVRGII